jgi:hypothetical protein
MGSIQHESPKYFKQIVNVLENTSPTKEWDTMNSVSYNSPTMYSYWMIKNHQPGRA